MSRKRKLIWLSLAALPVVVVLAALLWPRTALPPQIVTLPNGDKYQFLGVTYGTNHIFGSATARIVHRLPAPLAKFARTILGERRTQVFVGGTGTQPSLFVWFQVTATNTSLGSPGLRMVRAKIADEHDVESGVQMLLSYQAGIAAVGDFLILPRRGRTLQLSFYEVNTQDEILREIGRVKFPNPVYGKFPQWQPDTGPLVRKAGDLEVRLDKFFVGKRSTGAPVWTSSGQAPDYRSMEWGERAETVFDFSLTYPEGGNGSWLLHKARLSDAAGNLMDNSGLSTSAITESRSQSFNGALWPDESAWKLKLEFKRASGFASNELVTFKKVPVPKMGTTNQPNLALSAGDVRLVLTEFVRRLPQNKRLPGGRTTTRVVPGVLETAVRVETPGRSEGLAVDLVRMVTDTGDELLENGRQWVPAGRIFTLSTISTNAQTVDITFAVQKTRAVEFLLKPPAVVSQ